MGVNTGAGAAVSSGAGYQARVASYVLATAICEVESVLPYQSTIQTLGFETAEEIDDINIRLLDGRSVFIQAKANLVFSLTQTGELRSALQQFEAQDAKQPNDLDMFVIATSSRSSKKISNDLRAALEAFRTSPEHDFFRDQPKVITDIVTEIRATLYVLQEEANRPINHEAVDRVLRKSYVLVLDLEMGDPLERAVILILQANKFIAPTAVWGKLVSDCIDHAKNRHTLALIDIKNKYGKYRSNGNDINSEAAEALIQIELGELNVMVGKEIVLCRVPSDTPPFSEGLAIMEFYRFDDNCEERINFTDDTVILGNGLSFSLIHRSATFLGLTRLIDNNELYQSEELTIYEANLKEDVETNPCAEVHRARLRQAIKNNQHLFQCLYCGRPISEESPYLIETGSLTSPNAGFCHTKCLLPSHRIIGKASFDFFKDYPELVHFDANAWLQASHGGQMGIAGAQSITNRTVYINWGGDKLDWSDGQFVVEVVLQGGSSEIVTHRNNVHRFSKSAAEEFVIRLNKSFDEARTKQDPWCYSDQTKAFSFRSMLLEQLGGKEKILPVEAAKVRRYEERFTARYRRPGHWYAPLLYLTDLETGEPFSISNTVPIISDPLKLGNFLQNWQEVGIDIPDYETISILTDPDFDRFMRSVESRGWYAVIDPILDPNTCGLVSGFPIGSIEAIKSLTENNE